MLRFEKFKFSDHIFLNKTLKHIVCQKILKIHFRCQKLLFRCNLEIEILELLGYFDGLWQTRIEF